MATAASQNDDVVPLSAADKRLQASLNRTKFACSDFMDNQNKTTEANFSYASKEHVKALEGAGLKKQAGYMRKVEEDFRKASSTSKKERIVEFLARTLLRLSVKELAGWGIAGAVSAAGVVYAVYEIGDHGQLVDVSDTNLDGWTDIHRIDTDGDGVADLTLVDQDFDGTFDQLTDGCGEVIAEGGLFEGFMEIFANFFG